MMRNDFINDVAASALDIRQEVLRNRKLSRDLDRSIDHIPKPKVGSGDIRFIILGQDPTVKNEKGRRQISTVLNLDKANSLYTYLSRVIEQLGGSLEEHAYATNLLKCFFRVPPAFEPGMIERHLGAWIGLLKTELAAFPNAVVLSLGEPVIQAIVTSGYRKVRDYWGYAGNNSADVERFSYIRAENNLLGRDVFPLPHQPSVRKVFYSTWMGEYLHFVRKSTT
ncbi:MAG: hypothetical protein KBA61_05475 [Spirochaetes bacterium]|nr:hypothetical protein [Spirochaetota bacterium]